MNTEEKRKIAYRMTTIAGTSMDFVNDYLYSNSDKTDCAYLRSLYILLSYSFELILKSRVVMLYNSDCMECLDRKLKNMGHDFKKISKNLGSDELNDINIDRVDLIITSYPTNLKKKYKFYKITTVDNKKISIEDFIDIRYGSMNGGVRYVDNTEHKKIIGYIENMEKIYKIVKSKNAI